jgi:hypothetical protein
MVKRTTEKINSDELCESVAKNYEFIEGAQHNCQTALLY